MFMFLMSGSSHIRSVLIGVEYRNWYRILDVYLLFVICMGQIQLKVKTDLHVCNLWTGQLQVCNLVLIKFVQEAKSK